MSGTQVAYTSLINSLIKGDVDAVYLHKAKLQKTKGSDPQWFIRPYIDISGPEGIESRPTYIYLGRCAEVGKREAETKRRRYLDNLSRKAHILSSQIPFGDFIRQVFIPDYIDRVGVLSDGVRITWNSYINNHILPFFADKPLHEIDTRLVERFFDGLKKKDGKPLAWATKNTIKGILSICFEKADDWRFIHDRKNPVAKAKIGRQEFKREKILLSDRQCAAIVAELPRDLAEVIETIRCTTMRVSEVLGLQWHCIDWEKREFIVKQKFYRGKIGIPKTKKSERRIPMGRMAEMLALRYPGPTAAPEFIFNVETENGICRDERVILYGVTKAAKKLGLYHEGFGFRSFRREAITRFEQELGQAQTMKLSGHTRPSTMHGHYIIRDAEAQEEAVRKIQQQMGMGEGPVQ